ncbi:MAG: S9 family peptidase [Candidatus Saccharicenans sp.]|uniref:S9 family peptidase n=1 Tax=Candidatus Saccharicenans sp. TaxID=2819258 RepID=UPI00404AE736
MRRKRFFLILIGLLLITSSLWLSGQDKNFDPWLSPERIFQNREFAPESFGPARWLPDGRTYTTVEKSDRVEGGMDIVAYAAETGQRKILVSATSLTDPASGNPLRIEGYSWSKDGRLLLIFTNSRRVWRLNTRGDYWVFDLVSGRLKKLGKKFEQSSLMFAKFSPAARKVAYVYRNNIYVEDIESGQVDQLTSDGSEVIINGTADWVYEEEFNLRDGFRWSPDGRYLAFWRFDTSSIQDYYLINNTDYLYPKIIPIKYPKVGTMNSEVRIGLVNIETGKIDWIELPGDSRKDYYLPLMDWTQDSQKIIFQRLNRLQNTNHLMLFDLASRELRTIFTDQDEAWVEVMADFIWFNGGKSLLWLSERDGWNQVYEISLDGRPARQITEGGYDVVGLSGLDEKRGWLYFIASPDDAARRYLYRVGLKPGSSPERVTPAGLAGTHSYQISPGGGFAIHTCSTFDSPPVIDLIDLPRHRVLRTLVSNDSLKSRLGALKRKPVEFFQVDNGQALLDGWCLKPPDFDEKKNYPVIVYVYGEPAAQTVLDRWGGNSYLWHLLLAQKGYMVISIDNRGTPAPKGRDWRKCIYRQVGILAPADQAAAIRALLKKWPWLDGSRIGVWGWSGGGQMTLNAMFKYPELYRTGIAIAFVSNQLLYDTIYQERYMGLPEDNPEGYREGSPINFAGNLKGQLLIIHGTGDDNVHYQSFEKLVNELIANNKLFCMMAYPNRSHGISEGKNTTLHLYRTMLDFFLKNVPVK